MQRPSRGRGVSMQDDGSQLTATMPPRGDIAMVATRSSRLIGCHAPDAEPGVDAADWLSVTRFAEVSSDDNPLYTDVRYGAASPHRTMLAPPAFVLALRSPCSTGALDLIPNELVSRVDTLEVTWYDTIRLGDRLAGRVRVDGVGHRAEPGTADQVRITSTAEYERDGVRFALGRAEVSISALPTHDVRPIHRYGQPEIDRMSRELDDEADPRGPRPRHWGDVRIGDALPSVLRGPLTISDLEAWVIAAGRPVRAGNLQQRWLAERDGRRRAHPLTGWPAWDRAEAALDSAVTEPAGPAAPAELLFTLACQLVTSWMGDDGFLRSLSLRVGEPFRYGDAVRLSGSVRDLYRLTGADGRGYHAAAVRMTGVNQLTQTVFEADAVTLLPQPGRPVHLPVPAVLHCDVTQER
ncbi:FAS1-like dehydratase domain-containing protein [Catenuloplanes atrovinosus]|uniref:Acyl dehydratase n=1 Tax=Catenuloplanes atrovinosus TaxID=137266 RepID=A0AAE4C8I9_9ACTN|nr:MaoC family dehydratase N-terminal domain-containing protein [Catenuloplanes atrovinosus]MDR7275576.1 acyl dehydratase [Catenuloplanes atrovinosus]